MRTYPACLALGKTPRNHLRLDEGSVCAGPDRRAMKGPTSISESKMRNKTAYQGAQS